MCVGANVTLTDVGVLVAQLQHNIISNSLQKSVQARELFWYVFYHNNLFLYLYKIGAQMPVIYYLRMIIF